MSDFWKNSGFSDYNFDGRVDYFDVMIAEDAANSIGPVTFSRKKAKNKELENEPLDAKPVEMFFFSILFFLICTGMFFALGLIFWIFFYVGIGVEDAAGIVMISSAISGSIISLIVTICWTKRNKKLLLEKKKKGHK